MEKTGKQGNNGGEGVRGEKQTFVEMEEKWWKRKKNSPESEGK